MKTCHQLRLNLGALVLTLLATASAWAGTIKVKVESAEPVLKAQAIQRYRTMGGLYSKPIDGTLVDGVAVFEVPEGRFDLAFITESGRFEGWDTSLPRSDYEEEQPLSEESKQKILLKMGTETICGFADEAWVIDVRGNIQHAAALLYQLRTQPWSESMGMNDRQWIYRVDRWQWECPDDETWTTAKEVPYYALHRERIPKGGDKDLRITFSHRLGGIVLTKEKPSFDAGTIKLPKLTPGIHAMEADGTLITPIKVKPRKGDDGIRKKNTEAPDPAPAATAPAQSDAPNKNVSQGTPKGAK